MQSNSRMMNRSIDIEVQKYLRSREQDAVISLPEVCLSVMQQLYKPDHLEIARIVQPPEIRHLILKGIYPYAYRRTRVCGGIRRFATPQGFTIPDHVTYDSFIRWMKIHKQRVESQLNGIEIWKERFTEYNKIWEDEQQDKIVFLNAFLDKIHR